MAKKLLPLLPEHHTYVEPFAGGCSLLFAKQPARVEVINDLDSGLVNFYRVLRHPGKFRRFRRLAALTPYSREEYNLYRRTWPHAGSDVIRAYRWYVVARMSFSGRFGAGWAFEIRNPDCRMASSVLRWLSGVAMLPAIHERIQSLEIEHSDWRYILGQYDTPETLFYCDPPYITDTRRGGRYAHELTDDDHRELVTRLLALEGMAVLSGYAHAIYEPLEAAGWQRTDFATVCHAAGRTQRSAMKGDGAILKYQKRTESVWLSPGAQQQTDAQRQLSFLFA
jgi:DNA adenine methylase